MGWLAVAVRENAITKIQQLTAIQVPHRRPNLHCRGAHQRRRHVDVHHPARIPVPT